MKQDIEIKAYKAANKFIKKVEIGMARSKETYADMKDLVECIEKNRHCTCEEDRMRMVSCAVMTTRYCNSCGYKGLSGSSRTPDLCSECAIRRGVCGYCVRTLDK